MNNIYVLLILSHVYMGYVPYSQEFESLERCKEAKEFFDKNGDGFLESLHSECVKK